MNLEKSKIEHKNNMLKIGYIKINIFSAIVCPIKIILLKMVDK